MEVAIRRLSSAEVRALGSDRWVCLSGGSGSSAQSGTSVQVRSELVTSVGQGSRLLLRNLLLGKLSTLTDLGRWTDGGLLGQVTLQVLNTA